MATQEPEPVTVHVAPSAKAYLDALAEYLRALHDALGGGRVQVTIEEPGATSIVEPLETTLEDALKETNVIRKGGGEADY